MSRKIMNPKNKRAVIYCRVSTKGQVEEGNSLATQERFCEEYALANEYEIAEKFIEEGESAKTRNRTELKRLLNYCADRKNQVSVVIIYKLDRISRNTGDYIQIRLLLKKYKVEIKSTSEHFENTPAGRFMENTLANVAQFDNDVRAERSVNGLKDAMREGRYVWIAPYGYDNSRSTGKATVVQNERALVVRKTFEEIAKNIHPVEVVRKIMLQQGLVNKAGKPLSRSQFYRMLKNEAYSGWIIRFGERHKGTYEPIVSEELFEQVQRVLKRRSRRNTHYKLEHPDFPLRRFVTHPDGWRLTGSWSQGHTKKYAYYRFKQARRCEIRKAILEERFKDFMNQFHLDEKHYSTLRKAVEKNLVKTGIEKQKQREQLKGYLNQLKEKQSALIQKNIQGVITDNILRQQLEIIEGEEMKTAAVIARLPDRKVSIERLFDFVSLFLKNPSEVWSRLSISAQIKLQWFEFPQGVVFDGMNFRTHDVCRLFKVKKKFLPELSHDAETMHKSSNSIEVTSSEKPLSAKELYWEAVEKEIVDLYKILKS